MIVAIDDTSPLPAYEQLRAQVEAMVLAGTLAVGDRLPPIRRLASDLGLAPGTVQRAYRELEESGLVRGQGRRGTRVAARDEWSSHATDDDPVAEAAHRLAVAVRQVDATAAAAHAALDDALAVLAADDGAPPGQTVSERSRTIA